MRTILVFLCAWAITGCSSVQNKVFSLNTEQDYRLESSDSLKFSLLCEQLGVIAYMNLLEKAPDIPKEASDESCHYISSESYSGYSFAFIYNTSEDRNYSESHQGYSNETAYSKKIIELSAHNNLDNIEILLKTSNQDKAFSKLSFLVDKLLKQEYKNYYTSNLSTAQEKPDFDYD